MQYIVLIIMLLINLYFFLSLLVANKEIERLKDE